MSCRIRQKLKEEKGASLSVALLFFLFCAVIAVIVLTAGTAAAGRLSGAEKAERSSQSVASAAKTMAGMLEEVKIVITESRESDYTTTTQLTRSTEGDAWQIWSSPTVWGEALQAEPAYRLYYGAGTSAAYDTSLGSDSGLLLAVRTLYVEEQNAAASGEKWTLVLGDRDKSISGSLTLTPSYNGAEAGDMAVTADLLLDRYGNITMIFVSSENSDGGSLKLTAQAAVETNFTEHQSVSEESVKEEPGGLSAVRTEKGTLTETKVTTITFSGIRITTGP